MSHKQLTWVSGEGEEAKKAVRSRATAWAHKNSGAGNYKKGKRETTTGKRARTLQPAVADPADSDSVSPIVASGSQTPAGCYGIATGEENDDLGNISSVMNPTAALAVHIRARNLMGPFLSRLNAIVGNRHCEWVIAATINADDFLLNEAFDALVVGLRSTTGSDPSLRAEAHSRCSAILPQFQQRLNDQRVFQLKSTPVIMFLLTLHELLIWHNVQSWILHVNGMSTLIELRGPEAFTTGPDRLMFKWFRQYVLALDIFMRRASPFASAQWLRLSQEQTELSDQITDLLVNIPGLFIMASRFRAGQIAFEDLNTEVRLLLSRIRRWTREKLVTASRYLARFGCVEVSMDTLIASLNEPATFDLDFTQSVVAYLSGLLLLTRLGPHFAAMLPRTSQELVRDILAIAETWSTRPENFGVLSWLFAMRVAFFDAAEPGAAQVIALCERIQSLYSASLLTSIVGSI